MTKRTAVLMALIVMVTFAAFAAPMLRTTKPATPAQAAAIAPSASSDELVSTDSSQSPEPMSCTCLRAICQQGVNCCADTGNNDPCGVKSNGTCNRTGCIGQCCKN